jgi:hypothetical protein
MSKKTRRQKKRARQTTVPQQQPQSQPGGLVDPQPSQLQPSPGPARPQQQAPAYASRVTGPRRQPAQTAAATIDIDARVPHFASDLRRIALTAGTMILLIVVISFFIK